MRKPVYKASIKLPKQFIYLCNTDEKNFKTITEVWVQYIEKSIQKIGLFPYLKGKKQFLREIIVLVDNVNGIRH